MTKLWTIASVIAAAAITACGLDGVTGTLIHTDGQWYRIHTMEGKELRVHVDQRTRKDAVSVGDRVHLYVSKDGHAEFVQRIE